MVTVLIGLEGFEKRGWCEDCQGRKRQLASRDITEIVGDDGGGTSGMGPFDQVIVRFVSQVGPPKVMVYFIALPGVGDGDEVVAGLGGGGIAETAASTSLSFTFSTSQVCFRVLKAM